MISKEEISFNKSIGINNQRRLHLEISYGCNIRCRMCTFHDDHKKVTWMPYESIKNIKDGLDRFGLVHIGDGSEPLINPEWEKIFKHFTNEGIKVSIQTNGKKIRTLESAKRLVATGVHAVSISLDGVTDETVGRIREGTDFSSILKAVDYIIEAKKLLKSDTPYLFSNCVAMRSNLNEIPELTRLLLDRGFIRLRIGFLELRKADPSLVSELLIYDSETAKRIAGEVREIVKKSGKNIYLDLELFEEGQSQVRLEQCTVYHDRIYVRQDGESFACYGKKRIGNIFEDGIEKCLSSEAYEDHCKTVTQKGNPICSRCSFCRIMSLDNINNHFGRRAIETYTQAVVEDSMRWVRKGRNVEEFWDRIHSEKKL